jgi:hypothetical protein
MIYDLGKHERNWLEIEKEIRKSLISYEMKVV